MFLVVLLTRSYQWFRYWLGAEQATSHYLNQWRPSLLTHICVIWPRRFCAGTWQRMHQSPHYSCALIIPVNWLIKPWGQTVRNFVRPIMCESWGKLKGTRSGELIPILRYSAGTTAMLVYGRLCRSLNGSSWKVHWNNTPKIGSRGKGMHISQSQSYTHVYSALSIYRDHFLNISRKVWGVVRECKVSLKICHCNCCWALCTIMLYMTAIYRESIVYMIEIWCMIVYIRFIFTYSLCFYIFVYLCIKENVIIMFCSGICMVDCFGFNMIQHEISVSIQTLPHPFVSAFFLRGKM